MIFPARPGPSTLGGLAAMAGRVVVGRGWGRAVVVTGLAVVVVVGAAGAAVVAVGVVVDGIGSAVGRARVGPPHEASPIRSPAATRLIGQP